MATKASEIKRGFVVRHNNQTWRVAQVGKSAPQGRGGNTTYHFALYQVPSNVKLDLALRADDTLEEVDLVRRPVAFSYMDGEAFVFLDNDDYTPYHLDPGVVGDGAGYITEGLEGAQVLVIDGSPIGLQLPQSVLLEVVDTPPELKGASATKRSKPAKLNTGLELQVPEYIVNGEKIWVNTETGEFSGRE